MVSAKKTGRVAETHGSTVSFQRQKSTGEIFHGETFSDMIHNHREENCW
ncbi:BnaA06g15860D [Brassica napus]|uniref:BnaA06g15860D protein n=1 Tax=Brassica napus TaxID=3708 RepID=A0A078F0Z7_BRANA|nr:BnaA06g15860D [Brassica napus]